MMDTEDGDFGANFDTSPAIKNMPSKKLISNLYTGVRNILKPAPSEDEAPEDTYVKPEDKSIFGDELPWSTSKPSSRGGKRDLQNSNSTTGTGPIIDRTKYIANPVICLTLGSAVFFDNLSPTKYPIYMKDSLLNTNERFDYG